MVWSYSPAEQKRKEMRVELSLILKTKPSLTLHFLLSNRKHAILFAFLSFIRDCINISISSLSKEDFI